MDKKFKDDAIYLMSHVKSWKDLLSFKYWKSVEKSFEKSYRGYKSLFILNYVHSGFIIKRLTTTLHKTLKLIVEAPLKP